MFDDDLDPENDATATDGDDTEGESATDDNDQQSDGNDDSNVDWEKRYKGLQRATEKKRNELEAQLETAQKEIESTTTELEEVKGDTGSLEKKKTEAEESKEKLENEIQTLQSEHDSLQKQIDQQNIVMTDFPHLAPVAKFIPAADDEEGFRKGAEELSTAINTYVDKGVETSLKGSSATFEEGDSDDMDSGASELEEAWQVVYQYAGNPEKQEEYDAAYAIIEKAGANQTL
jgi:chromosome segregation ATPase